jgi:RNA polymerase sigma factor (sigma-70 family)
MDEVKKDTRNIDDIRATRQTLIQRLKNTADDEAWKEFYDFYWQLVSRWARSFGCSPEKADDVFQETMVCLLRNISTFEYTPAKGSFRSYLKTIVRSRCYDLFRKESRYIATGDDSDKNCGTSKNPDFEDDTIWLDSLVQQALRRVYGKVDQQTYKSFCMYVLEGTAVNEVSSKMGGLRVGTIYQQKSRMLKMLEKEFLALLEEMGESLPDNRGRGVFIKAFEEMINQRPEYRETMLNPENLSPCSCPDIEVFELIKPAMRNLPESNNKTPCHYLCVIENGNAREYKWHKLDQSVTVGSKDECDLVLQGDQLVSGLHLEILRERNSFHIRDCNSANGSYLNRKKLEAKAELTDGDLITIGANSLLVFNRL